MRLGNLLHRDVVRVGMEADTKEWAIEELVDVLVDAHEIPMSMRDYVVELVLERETHHSTGMEHGIAIPHGYTDRVEDVVAAIGIAKEGIPFESLDGIAARIIVLLVLPRRNINENPHTMAGIANLLSTRELRERLKSARTAEEVMRAIEDEEAKDSFSSVPTRF